MVHLVLEYLPGRKGAALLFLLLSASCLYTTSEWWRTRPGAAVRLPYIGRREASLEVYAGRVGEIPLSSANRSEVLKLHAKRIETLVDFCARNPVTFQRPLKASPMLGVPQLSLWYCPMAKSASTSWKYFLGTQFTRKCPSVLREDIHKCVDKTLNISKFRRPLKVSIIVVKNPWQRLVSGYIDKVSLYRPYYTRPMYKFFGVNISRKEPISFGQFAFYLAKWIGKSQRMVNWHFSPQLPMCDFCGRAKHHNLIMVKVETIMSDFRHVMLEAGVSNDTLVDFYMQAYQNAPRENHEVQQLSSSMYCCLFESLDNITMSMLVEKYRSDAEALGYEPHPLKGQAALKCSATAPYRNCTLIAGVGNVSQAIPSTVKV